MLKLRITQYWLLIQKSKTNIIFMNFWFISNQKFRKFFFKKLFKFSQICITLALKKNFSGDNNFIYFNII